MRNLAPWLIAVSLILASPTAQAQQSTLTLACKGTATSITQSGDKKPGPIEMGLIFNFATRIVQGFVTADVVGLTVRITAANDVTIMFSGADEHHHTLSGIIDRVTGSVDAADAISYQSGGESTTRYQLQCKPTQRMF
jgi:hypothetical protein